MHVYLTSFTLQCSFRNSCEMTTAPCSHPHIPSPVRVVSYCMFTWYCYHFVPPPLSLSTLTPHPTPPTQAILYSLPRLPDFLVITSWHARYMLTDGCPGLCNNNGRCVLDQNVWHCICQSGWRGLGCDVATEMLCSDGKDNEGGRRK